MVVSCWCISTINKFWWCLVQFLLALVTMWAKKAVYGARWFTQLFAPLFSSKVWFGRSWAHCWFSVFPWFSKTHFNFLWSVFLRFIQLFCFPDRFGLARVEKNPKLLTSAHCRLLRNNDASISFFDMLMTHLLWQHFEWKPCEKLNGILLKVR